MSLKRLEKYLRYTKPLVCSLDYIRVNRFSAWPKLFVVIWE